MPSLDPAACRRFAQRPFLLMTFLTALRAGFGFDFFVTSPDEMFSLDRFHPSARGYKRTAKAMLPSVLAALGVVDEVPFGHHAPHVGGSG